jgi:rRNA maturation protein Rpf1
MLITTSRRPCHRARLLGRELERVLPNAKYTPRGVKSIRKLTSLANSLNHKLIMIIESCADQPSELLFLDATVGWRWLGAKIELGEIKLQRDLNQKVRLTKVKITASNHDKARKFARLIGKIWGMPFSEEPPSSGGAAFVDNDRELRVQFHTDIGAAPVGPILTVKQFEGFNGES